MPTPKLASARPLPYQDLSLPTLHHGVVSVTGSKTVDLKITHNNFDVTSLCIKGGLTKLAKGHILAWDYGTQKGTFVITIAKHDAAFGDLIAATAALDVSFSVMEGTPVTL